MVHTKRDLIAETRCFIEAIDPQIWLRNHQQQQLVHRQEDVEWYHQKPVLSPVDSHPCLLLRMLSMGAAMTSQMWRLTWVILLMGLRLTEAVDYAEARTVTAFPDITNLIVTTVQANPDHRSTICSTWGNFHFKTFDGHFFQAPDTCNYILAGLCKPEDHSDFNIKIQGKIVNNLVTFGKITVDFQGTVIELTNNNITMDQQELYNATLKNGITVMMTTSSVKISNNHGVNVFWEKDQSLLIELPEKYQNQTCGLCGNFNGDKTDDSFDNDLANWKVNPLESCEVGKIHSNDLCQNQTSICQLYLSSPGFSDCYSVMDMSSFEEACVNDLCQCYGNQDCLCNTLTEISRQCAHSGGNPGTWRTEQLCPKTCPLNLLHMECGSPCKNTCSDPDARELCKEHCVDGCFCPFDLVEDDIGQSGCVPVDECPCVHDGMVYQSGESYEQACKKCNCTAGRWTCTYLKCPGICSVVGGSHITTYDGKTFTFSGNCDYIFTKHTNDSDIAVVGNLAQCDWARSDTCLNSVTLVISETTISFSSNGVVTLNGSRPYKLPATSGPVSIFQPSSSFIIADMKSLRLEIQLAPVMQMYIVASTEEKGKMTGLCGNYNDVQLDDFKTELGIKEDTPIPFVNYWKNLNSCPNLENTFDNPCSMHSDIENAAKNWCSHLTNPIGLFSACHLEISPNIYYKWCVYDTCKCADIRKCMCAAVSNYAHACAARGIIIQGWMDSEPCVTKCSGNMKYSYGMSSCDSTCRSLSEEDDTCKGSFTPVDGCACPKDTYLNDENICVTADRCPCYSGNRVIKPSEIIYKNGVKCTCNLGKLHCSSEIGCVHPMIFFNCSAEQGNKGTECQGTCEKQDPSNCVSTWCVSGCMCPDGLLADGKGGCVERKNCPCVHNGLSYSPGEQVQEDCNTCTCTDGMWNCTQKACYGTCTIYGEGHFRTFDGKSYSLYRECKHTIARDNCNMDQTLSFSLVTQNKLCETTNTICKSISLLFGRYEILLSEDGVKVLEGNGTDYQYQIHSAGIYIVTEVKGLLNLIWDNKTSLMLQVDPKFKGKVCGLCGDFDGNANNDFKKHNGEVVTDSIDFGDSWRVDPNCPDVTNSIDFCKVNQHRSAWAEKRCTIIRSDVFEDCHALVDSGPYFDACVRDTCACDSGGDCDCFCTAVAAYAAECRKKGACVAWRTPGICPLFCDYYNPPEKCKWHYKSCGPPCLQTCKNPSGACSDQIPLLEGCFPQCPPETPYLLDETMTCVQKCNCTYDNKQFSAGSTVYEDGPCFKAVCAENGKIVGSQWCNITTTAGTSSTSSTTTTRSTTTPPIPTTTTTTTVTPPSTTTGSSPSSSTTTSVSTTTPRIHTTTSTIPTTTTSVTPPSTTTGPSTTSSTTTTGLTTTPPIPTTTTTITPPSTPTGSSPSSSTTTSVSTTTPRIPTTTSTIPTTTTSVTPPSTTTGTSTTSSTTTTGSTTTPPIPTTTTTITPPSTPTGSSPSSSTTTSVSTTTPRIPTTTSTIPTTTTSVTPPSTTTGSSTTSSTTTSVSTTTPRIPTTTPPIPTTTTSVTPPSTTTGTSTTSSTTTTGSTTTPPIPTTTTTITPPSTPTGSSPSSSTTTSVSTTTPRIPTTTSTIPTTTNSVTPPSTTTGSSTTSSTTTSVSTTTPRIPTTTPPIPTTTTSVTPPSTTTGTSTTSSTTTTGSTTTPPIPTTTTTITPPSTPTGSSPSSSTTTSVSTTTPRIPTTTSTIPTTTTSVTPPSTTTGSSTTSSTTTSVSTTTPRIPTTTSTIPTTTTSVTPPSTTTGTSTTSSTTTTGSTTTPPIPTTTTTITPPSTPTGSSPSSSTTTSVSTTTPRIPTTTSTIPTTTNSNTLPQPPIPTTTTSVTPPSTTTGTSTTSSTTTTGSTTTPPIPTTTTTITPPSTPTGSSPSSSTTTSVSTTTPRIPTTTSTIPTTTTSVTPPSTTTGSSTTSSTTTSVSTTTTPIEHQKVITTTFSTSTTSTCFCTYENVKFPAGSTINSLQDECYKAYCNSTCFIVKEIQFDNDTVI
ncbi:mucin-2 [Puntigrus tetrazona]|uniref:mucin-2 n=1 Tax=Puntigrus tetrazona TaxID=1606681 RepID=UPI001C8A5B69|nr:mucin-2 [Puntigrus tetrazona]